MRTEILRAAASTEESGGSSGSRAGERRLARFVLAAALVLAVWILWKGWGRWPDLLIDFGRELYVPWRLSEGDVLYRDIAHFNGPLSPYFNALCFRLFGTGMWTLAWVNLALLGLLACVLFRRIVAMSSELAASCVLCFSVAAFAFGQQAWSGNYNFITPYSHEITHGLLLALCALASASRPGLGKGPLLQAGLFLGLAFLTKPEPFLAGTCGVAVYVFTSDTIERSRRSAITTVMIGALLPVLAAGLLLSLAMPLAEAWTGLLGSWAHLLNRDIAELAFYRSLGGWDAPASNALVVLQSAGWLCVAIAPGILLARLLGGRRTRGSNATGLSIGLLFVVSCLSLGVWMIAGKSGGEPAFFLARGLPLALLVVLSCSFFWGRREPDPLRRGALVELAALATFGLVLLTKIILNVRFHHYGVFLALPGAAAVLAFLLHWLPDALTRKLVGHGRARACIIACVLGVYGAAGAELWRMTNLFFEVKTGTIGAGGDRMRTDFRGPYASAALDRLSEHLGPDEEFLVLPEGVTLNYLARRKTPTRFLNFMPLELLLFGEEAVVAALEKHPPAAVLFVHKDTTEYGYPFFGRDYGLGIQRWVRENYEEVWVESRGGKPLEPGTIFGISLFVARP